MKFAIFAVLMSLSLNAAAQTELSYETILSAFLSQSDSLKTQTGQPVAKLLGADLLQHYSGNQGSETTLECFESQCNFKVQIHYKPGPNDEAGMTQTANYKFKVSTVKNKIVTSNVIYSITEPQ